MVFDAHRARRRRRPSPRRHRPLLRGAGLDPSFRLVVSRRDRLEPSAAAALRGPSVRVRDAGDFGTRALVRSPDQSGHRHLPVGARTALDSNPPHLRGRAPRRGAIGRLRSVGHLRRRYPRPGPRGRRDNGGHHDDRKQERDLRVSVRPGTDDRELDRQQLHGGGDTARVERIHRARPRPHAHVVDHQHLREAHGRPGASSRGGSRVKLPLDRDTRRRWIDVAMGVAAFVCVVIAIIPLGSILLEASIRGLRSLSPALLASTTGGGGIGNAIQGTLILILLSALVSLPVGILTGIYLAEFGKNRLGAAVRFFVEVMTQVPSMVVGIFVYSLVLELGLIGLGSPRLVFSTISGVLALSTIMVPFVARTSEEALRLVPIAVRESSLALGIPRYRTILRVVVPSASSALVTGGLLGIARVAGETAPLLVTAFGSNDWFRGLDQPIESLPHTIYVWATGPYVAQNQAAWGVSLVLVVMMLGLSIVSRVVIRLRSVSR